MMTTTSPSVAPVPEVGDHRHSRKDIPVPRPAADDAPDKPTSTDQSVTYPGIRYALECLSKLPRTAAEDCAERGDRT